MKNNIKKNRGFTLVEMLVGGGIMTVLLMILTQVFLQTLEMRLAAEAESAVTQDVRYIFSRLSYDMSRADAVTVPGNWGENGSSLTLDVGGEDYIYTLDQGNLTLSNDSGGSQINSVTVVVDSVMFTKLGEIDGKDSVQMSLEVSSVAQRTSGPVQRSLVTTVGIR